MIAVAVKITERPLDCNPEDFERLKGFGLTEEEAWDTIEKEAIDEALVSGSALSALSAKYRAFQTMRSVDTRRITCPPN